MDKKISSPIAVAIIIFCVILAGWAVFWECSGIIKRAPNVSEVKVAEEAVEDSAFNPQTTKLATILEGCEHIEVLEDKPCTGCCIDNFIFSPDGKRVAYEVYKPQEYTLLKENPRTFTMVIDGKEGTAYEHISSFTFSNDSEHYFYGAWDDAEKLVIFDGEEIFSDDSPTYFLDFFKARGIDPAYSVYNGDKYWMVDGRSVSSLSDGSDVSPDGEHSVYVERSESDAIRDKIIKDGQEVFAHYDVGYTILFLLNNKLIYTAKEDGKYFFFIDGEKKGGPYDYIGLIKISADGKLFTYMARKNDFEFVVVDGKEGQNYNRNKSSLVSYHSIGEMAFSPNGNHFAYIVNQGREYVVVDGISGPSYQKIGSRSSWLPFKFLFSPYNDHIAYIGQRDEQSFMVLDHEEIRGSDYITGFSFSPDSNHLAWIINEGGSGFADIFGGRWAVVVDGKKGREYDKIFGDPVFSKDGKYLSYGAQIGNEIWWIVDEVEHYSRLKEFDATEYLSSDAQNIGIKEGYINSDDYRDVLVYYEVLDKLLPSPYQTEDGEPNKYYLRTYLFDPVTGKYIQKREDQGTYSVMDIESYEFFDFDQDGKEEILVVKNKEERQKLWYVMYEKDNEVKDAQIDLEELTRDNIERGKSVVSIEGDNLTWRVPLYKDQDIDCCPSGGAVTVTYSSIMQDGILRFLIKETKADEHGISCEHRKGKYEMRIFDSAGRMTGIIDGEIKEEIPNSMYDYESNQSIIFSPTDTYIYETFCLEEGNYVFTDTSVEDGETSYFNANNIPIFPGMTHRLELDWEALNQGKEGATLLVDLDGNGTFEQTITSDNELTCEEFLSQLKLPQ